MHNRIIVVTLGSWILIAQGAIKRQLDQPPRDVAKGGGRRGRPPLPWGFQEAPRKDSGQRGPKAHVGLNPFGLNPTWAEGQNHVGGERNSRGNLKNDVRTIRAL